MTSLYIHILFKFFRIFHHSYIFTSVRFATLLRNMPLTVAHNCMFDGACMRVVVCHCSDTRELPYRSPSSFYKYTMVFSSKIRSWHTIMITFTSKSPLGLLWEEVNNQMIISRTPPCAIQVSCLFCDTTGTMTS